MGGLKLKVSTLYIVFSLFVLTKFVKGHGMMLKPIGRASRWRSNKTAISNVNDNQLFCGGYGVQWSINEGKCGLCGDDYRDPVPRAHEFGGIYGEGVIVDKYNQKDGKIPVSVKLTANHRGTFTWDICNMDLNKETEECFKEYKEILQIDGSSKYKVKSNEPGWFNTTLKIPEGLKCNHCVLRWTYQAGNNWGICGDGKGALGCGPQEHFRSCADIAILV